MFNFNSIFALYGLLSNRITFQRTTVCRQGAMVLTDRTSCEFDLNISSLAKNPVSVTVSVH